MASGTDFARFRGDYIRRSERECLLVAPRNDFANGVVTGPNVEFVVARLIKVGKRIVVERFGGTLATIEPTVSVGIKIDCDTT